MLINFPWLDVHDCGFFAVPLHKKQVLVNVSGELIGQKSRHFETMRDHHLRRCLELRALGAFHCIIGVSVVVDVLLLWVADKLPYARHEGAELPTRTLSPLPFILYYSLQREISRILRDPLGTCTNLEFIYREIQSII